MGVVQMNDFDIAKREFRKYYDANIALLRDAEQSLRTQVLDILADQPSFATPHVVSRIKAREECIRKFQRKYLPRLAEAKTRGSIESHIGDLIGIRVICLYEPDIKEISRLLSEEFDVLDIADKSREVEVTADTFRYKGLHLEMALSERRKSLPAYSRFASLRFEVQVRTAIQDAWSTLDHAIKYKKQVPHELSRRINALAALFEIADREFLAIKNQIAELAPCASASIDEPTAAGRTSAVFAFLPILQRHFPRFRFDDQKLGGFVDELQVSGPAMTPVDLDCALTSANSTLRKYAKYQWRRYRISLNPLTLVRHAVYLRDPAARGTLLSDAQRARFDEWRNDKTHRRLNGVERGSGAVGDARSPDWFSE
jgi:putative GTP pyrophosphokinase